MAFNTLTFIVFFALVLSLYHMPFSWRGKKWMLLVSSYVFYAAWNPPFIALLWLSTYVDWYAVKFMERSDNPHFRRSCLLVSLCTNLGLLGFFKYGNFALESFQGMLAMMGVEYSPPAMSIILPMGISFYTFQTMSYSIDVYRGVAKPWTSFLDFALYVTFFPQLVAGPIVRAVDFLPQCQQPKRVTAQQLGWGLCLVTIGLFEKNVLADGFLAPVADEIFSGAGRDSFLGAWVGTLAFSGQIFCDFAGYSSCGIGIALCMGFAMPDNFRFPYASMGLSDFWKRWHISLSSWLRDYLYIPLGGNRKGRSQTLRNLMATMLIGGLWHGAAWRFVAWGGLHGAYLAVERLLCDRLGHMKIFQTFLLRIGLCLLTYLLVCVSWVFFRAESFSVAFEMLTAMFSGGADTYTLTMRAIVAMMVVGLIMLVHWNMRDTSVEEAFGRLPKAVAVAVLTVLLLAILLIHGEDRAFIYFQF